MLNFKEKKNETHSLGGWKAEIRGRIGKIADFLREDHEEIDREQKEEW